MLRILVRNVVSNWVGFGVQVVVVFFLTPFVVHSLGDTRYGVWALVTSLTGYYGLLDLGFRSGITQYLTRHLATGDYDELSRTGSTAFVALACCGILVGLASLGMAWIAPFIFTIPPELVAEAQWCIAIVGFTTGLQFAFFLYSSVFAATQRYDLANIVSIAERLVTAAATIVALRSGYGLIAICSVNAAGSLFGSLARWRIAVHILPQMIISPGLTAWSNLRSIANFGIWSFLIQNAVTVKAMAGGLVIGLFMPVAALTPYSLALGLTTYFNSFFQSMAGVFFPAATQLDAQGDQQRLKTMYLAGSKILVLLAMTATLIGVVWAEDFYRLWVGERFVAGGKYPSVATMFCLLIASAFIATAQGIGNQVLLGRRQLRHLAAIRLGEAVASIVVSICLVMRYGLIGVTVGVLGPAIVFQGFIQPLVVCRSFAIPVKEYLHAVWMRPGIASVLVLVELRLLRSGMPAVHSWAILLLSGALAAFLAGMSLVVVGLDRNEQQRFVFRPLARLRVLAASRQPQDEVPRG